MNSNHRVLEPYDLWKGKLTLESHICGSCGTPRDMN
nr:MAG TPA: SAGA-associated factor 73-FINGER, DEUBIQUITINATION, TRANSCRIPTION FACTOR, SAGA [Crassvirales sp.]